MHISNCIAIFKTISGWTYAVIQRHKGLPLVTLLLYRPIKFKCLSHTVHLAFLLDPVFLSYTLLIKRKLL
jgi:hypothetical protein